MTVCGCCGYFSEFFLIFSPKVSSPQLKEGEYPPMVSFGVS